MSIVRTLVFAATVVVFVSVVASCGGVGTGEHRAQDQDSASPIDHLSWSGFIEIDGLEILDAHETRGLNRSVEFDLKGSSENIGVALSTAGFGAEWQLGMPFQEPIGVVDFATLQDLQHAQDYWQHPSGHFLARTVVRGTLSDGSQILHVMAFET